MTQLPTSAARQSVLQHVAEAVRQIEPGRRALVAIDGIDGAGKTTFADELARELAPFGRPAIRATVDGFHHPRSIRYLRGKGSPEGFYLDSYDYDALETALLVPFGPGGDGRSRRALFDVDTDTRLDTPFEIAPTNALLVFDGMFLHRPELRHHWDLSVFLRVEWPRNHHLRELQERGPVDPATARFDRYREGQEIYFRECTPWTRADIVIDNDDLAAPFIVPPTPRPPR